MSLMMPMMFPPEIFSMCSLIYMLINRCNPNFMRSSSPPECFRSCDNYPSICNSCGMKYTCSPEANSCQTLTTTHRTPVVAHEKGSPIEKDDYDEATDVPEAAKLQRTTTPPKRASPGSASGPGQSKKERGKSTTTSTADDSTTATSLGTSTTSNTKKLSHDSGSKTTESDSKSSTTSSPSPSSSSASDSSTSSTTSSSTSGDTKSTSTSDSSSSSTTTTKKMSHDSGLKTTEATTPSPTSSSTSSVSSSSSTTSASSSASTSAPSSSTSAASSTKKMSHDSGSKTTPEPSSSTSSSTSKATDSTTVSSSMTSGASSTATTPVPSSSSTSASSSSSTSASSTTESTKPTTKKISHDSGSKTTSESSSSTTTPASASTTTSSSSSTTTSSSSSTTTSASASTTTSASSSATTPTSTSSTGSSSASTSTGPTTLSSSKSSDASSTVVSTTPSSSTPKASHDSGSKDKKPECQPEVKSCPGKLPEKLEENLFNFSVNTSAMVLLNHPNKNVAFSPINAINVLFLLANHGADNDTKATLNKLLNVDPSVSNPQDYTKCLADSISKVTDGKKNLILANKVYLSKDLKDAKDGFKNSCEKLDMNPQSEDLKNGPDTAKLINNWSKNKTNDEVPEVASPDDVKDNPKVILASLAYANSSFLSPTSQVPGKIMFYLKDDKNTSKPVCGNHQMISDARSGNLPELKAQFVELLGDDKKASMVIILPYDNSTLTETLKNLPKLKHSDLQGKDVSLALSLPKFKAEGKVSPNDLKETGLPEILKEKGHFTCISDENPPMNNIIQKAVINSGESECKKTPPCSKDDKCAKDKEHVQVNVNRPFLVLIVGSKMILSSAIVNDPSS